MGDQRTIVIGAGLSGLVAAHCLVRAGRDVLVLEGRSRLGGRVHSARDPSGAYQGDLGPSWIWPDAQPDLGGWIRSLGLTIFPQYQEGDVIVDDGVRGIQRVRAPAQPGTFRIRGGPQSMVDALALSMDGMIRTGTRVTAIQTGQDRVRVHTTQGTYDADQIILAIPPRLAEALDWQPGLPLPVATALSAAPTWMAPHAKVLALFDRAVWKESGLSGRIVSCAGPLAEAHDLSEPDTYGAALYGFVGWPAGSRAQPDLQPAVHAQLQRIFGVAPRAIHIADWAQEDLTAHPDDLSATGHPQVAPDILRQPACSGRVIFAGAELSDRSPGLIDGALRAGDAAAGVILDPGRG